MSTKVKFKQIVFPNKPNAFIKGDGSFDTNNYLILDENDKIPEENIPNSLIIKALYYNDFINAEYIPESGETIIVIDYIKIDNKNVPSFAIGDGVTYLKNLSLSGDYSKCSEIANIAKKLEHTLTIGSYKFDGTEDVTIPIYDGNNQIN